MGQGPRQKETTTGTGIARWPAWVLALVLVSGCTGSSSPETDLLDAAADDAAAVGVGDGGSGLNLRASEDTVSAGGSVTLSWSAPDAEDCTVSGGWSGQRPTSGSETVGPINAGTTFSMTCSGPDGSSVQMISVAVVGPVTLSWVAPDENVDGSSLDDLAGYRIYYGQESRSYSDVREVADTSATSHTFDLASGEYFLAMTAVDLEGNESAYSNEVIRTLD